MKQSIMFLVFFGFFLVACKKEVKEPKLLAMYSFVVQGPKVSFNNISGYFDEYTWDFGDGNTSTQKAPVYIYKAKGKYVVTLTARKGDYVDTFIDTVLAQAPTITIDGQFDDWDYVSSEWKNPDSYNGTVLKFKSHYSDSRVFLYIEGASNMMLEPFQIYFDTDGNPATGYLGSELFPQGCGFEIRHEGNTTGWFNVQKFTGSSPNQWGVTSMTVPADYMVASSIISKNGKKHCEISIKKDLLAPLAKTMNVGIRDLNWSWQAIGVLPLQTGTSLKTMIPVQTRD